MRQKLSGQILSPGTDGVPKMGCENPEGAAVLAAFCEGPRRPVLKERPGGQSGVFLACVAVKSHRGEKLRRPPFHAHGFGVRARGDFDPILVSRIPQGERLFRKEIPILGQAIQRRPREVAEVGVPKHLGGFPVGRHRLFGLAGRLGRRRRPVQGRRLEEMAGMAAGQRGKTRVGGLGPALAKVNPGDLPEGLRDEGGALVPRGDLPVVPPCVFVFRIVFVNAGEEVAHLGGPLALSAFLQKGSAVALECVPVSRAEMVARLIVTRLRALRAARGKQLDRLPEGVARLGGAPQGVEGEGLLQGDPPPVGRVRIPELEFSVGGKGLVVVVALLEEAGVAVVVNRPGRGKGRRQAGGQRPGAVEGPPGFSAFRVRPPQFPPGEGSLPPAAPLFEGFRPHGQDGGGPLFLREVAEQAPEAGRRPKGRALPQIQRGHPFVGRGREGTLGVGLQKLFQRAALLPRLFCSFGGLRQIEKRISAKGGELLERQLEGGKGVCLPAQSEERVAAQKIPPPVEIESSCLQLLQELGVLAALDEPAEGLRNGPYGWRGGFRPRMLGRGGIRGGFFPERPGRREQEYERGEKEGPGKPGHNLFHLKSAVFKDNRGQGAGAVLRGADFGVPMKAVEGRPKFLGVFLDPPGGRRFHAFDFHGK